MSDYELDLWTWFICGVWPGRHDSADEPERTELKEEENGDV